MENPEAVLNLLDEFAKLKSKDIPNGLEEYLSYVAATGDPVYQWSLVKALYRQKLINVMTEFYETCPVVEIPRCPNVELFNYETMKGNLLKRFDSFSGAPFTIQRISELLTTPRKQYNRVDKFMRAIEKNIWVVSTREPGSRDTSIPQETSGSLVNGVTPRVCVTVKHPKGIKSIEERIKSGHPQLIDDEDDEGEEGEEIEEYEQMEEESNADIIPSSEVEESSLQCTSVKDLIEKYENGTIFSNAEEKTDFEEKSVQLEETIGASCDSVMSESEELTKSEVTVRTQPTECSEPATEPAPQPTTVLPSPDSHSEDTHPSGSHLEPICEMTQVELTTNILSECKEMEELPDAPTIEDESDQKELNPTDLQEPIEEIQTDAQKFDSEALNASPAESQPVRNCLEPSAYTVSSTTEEDSSLAMVVDEAQEEETTLEVSETPELEQNPLDAADPSLNCDSDMIVTFDSVPEGSDPV